MVEKEKKADNSINAYIETKGNLYQEMAKSDPLGLFSGVGFTPYNPSHLVTRKGLSIFDSMRKDEQVKAAMGFKKHAVLSSGWEIVSPEGQPHDWEVKEFVKWNLSEFIDSTLEDSLLGVLTAIDYGYSISELIWEKNSNTDYGDRICLKAIKNKRPHEFDFKVDEYGNLQKDGIIQRSYLQDLSLPVDKFVIFSYEKEFGNHYGKSDLESAYRAWWIKDNAYKWFAMMLERLGIPPIFALYDPSAYTKEQLTDLKTVISRLQAATTGIIPKGRGENSLEFWNPELAGESTDVFTKAFERFDMDITRALLMPGLLGASIDHTQGSFARSNVHFKMFMLSIDYLRSCLANIVIQEQIVRRLVDLNYAVKEYPTFRFLPIQGEVRTELLTAYITAVEKGIIKNQAHDEIHLRKELGFPPVDNISQVDIPDGLDSKKPDLSEETDKKEFTLFLRQPNQYEKIVNFERIDQRFGVLGDSVKKQMVESMVDSRDALVSFIDRNWGKIDSFLDTLKIKGFNDIQTIIHEMLRQSFGDGREEVMSELSLAGIKKFDDENAHIYPPIYIPKEALNWLKDKSFFISGVMKDDLVKQAQIILMNALKNGELQRETMQKLRAIFEPYVGSMENIVDAAVVTPIRLETIIRTNITESFNMGRLTMMRENADLIQGVEYSAILDDRTTEICRHLDGKIFRLDDPSLPNLTPPNHFNCRSIIVPVTISAPKPVYINGADKGRALDLVSPGFGGNIEKYTTRKEMNTGGDL